MKAENGDVIMVRRWRGIYKHYGVYVKTLDGQESVIHYTPEGGGDFNGIVRETSVKEFLQGARGFTTCKFHSWKHPTIYSGEETVRRARSKLGMGKYSLFGNNCEHFAKWCKLGEHTSSQVRRGTFWTIVTVFLVAVGASLNSSRRD